MSGNANEFYSREEKEAMADELQDQEDLVAMVDSQHYAVDDGFCSCGVLCETGTRLRAHQIEQARRKLRGVEERNG